MRRQRIFIGRPGEEGCRRIQRQDFAVQRRLHMFHLAFSSGEEHASAAFHSRNHTDLSRAGLQLTRLSRRPGSATCPQVQCQQFRGRADCRPFCRQEFYVRVIVQRVFPRLAYCHQRVWRARGGYVVRGHTITNQCVMADFASSPLRVARTIGHLSPGRDVPRREGALGTRHFHAPSPPRPLQCVFKAHRRGRAATSHRVQRNSSAYQPRSPLRGDMGIVINTYKHR